MSGTKIGWQNATDVKSLVSSAPLKLRGMGSTNEQVIVLVYFDGIFVVMA